MSIDPALKEVVLKKGYYLSKQRIVYVLMLKCWDNEYLLCSLTSLKQLRFFGSNDIRQYLIEEECIYLGRHYSCTIDH